MSKGLITTAVGSYPKPEYLISARASVARGQMSKEELEELEKKATQHWIKVQEDLGMDVLVDGEMYRGDMVTYFSEYMSGFNISGLVRSYGNRYYRKPIAVGPVARTAPLTVDWWKYSQSLTDKPVKGMLTGPYTICDWSFNEYYPTRESFIMDVAKAIHEEALELEDAGAKYIQIDEPAFSTRPEEMEMGSRALGIVTEGLKAITFTHICYGDFATVFDHIANLPVDVLDMETANSNYDLVDLFRAHPTEKILALGVLDVHNHQVESLDEIKAGIKKALEVFPADRLFIKPDCGLKTRLEGESIDKLKVMMQAVGEVKKEMGIE